jgi:hypothetical protein
LATFLDNRRDPLLGGGNDFACFADLLSLAIRHVQAFHVLREALGKLDEGGVDRAQQGAGVLLGDVIGGRRSW